VFLDVAGYTVCALEARQVVIARLPLFRKSADTVRLKIIASSLNLIPTPAPDKIFNAHPLDFFNANFDVPEAYCFAAHAACNIMIRPSSFEIDVSVFGESFAGQAG